MPSRGGAGAHLRRSAPRPRSRPGARRPGRGGSHKTAAMSCSTPPSCRGSSGAPHSTAARARGSCRCARPARAPRSCTRRFPPCWAPRWGAPSHGTRRPAGRGAPGGPAGPRSQRSCQSPHASGCEARTRGAAAHRRPSRWRRARRAPADWPSTCSGGAGGCARSSHGESAGSRPCGTRAMPRRRGGALRAHEGPPSPLPRPPRAPQAPSAP